jgi:hypothetical protein
MHKRLKDLLANFLMVLIVMGMTISFQSLWAAWTEPTMAPPDGNPAAPVNVGDQNQKKIGSLASVNDIIAEGYGIFDDGVGIGISGAPTQMLDVNGKVRMREQTSGTDFDDTVATKKYVDDKSGGAPAGTVSAFNMTSCPLGWVPANGAGGIIPDLRGRFIRGMESFENGTNAVDRDPDRSGAGTLRTVQEDEFRQHAHNYETHSGTSLSGPISLDNRAPWRTHPTSATGGNETRPKNVALIYCVKTSGSSAADDGLFEDTGTAVSVRNNKKLVMPAGTGSFDSSDTLATKGYVDSNAGSGNITFLPAPARILNDIQVLSPFTATGATTTKMTINLSSLVPENAKAIYASITSNWTVNDDRRGRQQFFAWSVLPAASGIVLDTYSPYSIGYVEAGKIAYSGGEGDRDYTGISNTFLVPLTASRTFQFALREIEVYRGGSSQYGYSLVLLGYAQ